MNSKISGKDLPFSMASFFIPFLLFYFTKSTSLMFDDAAEFALVIKLGSIAHPPGTPSYIIAGIIWTKLTTLFGMNIVDSLTLFSSICISTSSILLYYIFKMISSNISANKNTKTLFVCCLSALAFSTASTSWAWGNTVEVYSFQGLTMAITLYGLISYHFGRKKISILIAAIGIATGLGNHHLTMIFFLPFTPLFFLNKLFVPIEKINTKKIKKTNETFINNIRTVFTLPDFWVLTGITFLITVAYYGWMFMRAQYDYPFMFGKPSTISEFIYHTKHSLLLEKR